MSRKLKRIHLFEFEDQRWFPGWLRNCLTRLINVMHRLLKSADNISGKLEVLLRDSSENRIIDFCSGSGGPMPEVADILSAGFPELEMVLTDLYPNPRSLEVSDKHVHYNPGPVDALQPVIQSGIRTFICSFHHFPPESAMQILASAVKGRQPIFIYEISDNSHPKWLWWIAVPFNIISCLFITPMVRPLTWYQLLFTYLIPVIPLCFAWDGAVSNARTYSAADLENLISNLPENDYRWHIETLPGSTKKLALTGLPGSGRESSEGRQL